MSDTKKAWLAFASVSLFWGTTYLGIRIGVESFPVALFAGARHFIAGILILLYFFIKKYPIPTAKQFVNIVIMAVLMLGLGNGLYVWAEKYVSSSVAAIISCTTPFVIFFYSWLLLSDKPTGLVFIGILLGFSGQIGNIIERSNELKDSNYKWGIIAMFVAVFAWAFGSVYRKKTNITLHALYFTGWQMLIGGSLFFPLAIYNNEFSQIPNIEPKAWWAFAYLIIFGSIIAYGSFMYALQKLPPTIVSMHTYINTIVAVFLGWIVLSEKLNWWIAMSTILTLIGVYFVNKGMQKTKKAAK
ncbi:MAG: EamA family transporter [bacterium]